MFFFINAIKDSKSPAAFRAYTTKFPGGLFVDLANSRISSLEAEARENERKQLEAANDERIRNTRLFDVKHSDGTDGTLTIAPGAIAFEVRKRSEKNDRKNVIFQCSEIKRVEAGKSAFQPPDVNFYLVPVDGKERKTRTSPPRVGRDCLLISPSSTSPPM